MAFSKLTQQQEIAAQAWMHDVFVTAGMLQPKRALDITKYNYMYGLINKNGSTRFKQQVQDLVTCCKKLSQAVILRTVDYKIFQSLNATLNFLSAVYFLPDLKLTNSYYPVRKKPEMLAKYVAYFCVASKAFWDNSATTTYEMDEIAKTTLGKALIDFGCFTSQRAAKAKPATSTTVSGQSGAQSTNTSNGPANGYKASGPHSADIPNLLSVAGKKEYPTGNLMYCIQANKIGKNTPNAFITPLIATATGIAKVSLQNAEAVKFGSGNGYTDCTCWFEDINLATDFVLKCRSKFGAKFNNINVVKARSDSNGYYAVSTEFGNCFIKAKKLNELLEQDNLNGAKEEDTVVTYPSKQKLKVVRSYKIDDFDTFEEAFSKE